MKKIIVLMLSCLSITAWAQDNTNPKQPSEKKMSQTDDKSLDGRSFKITLQSKELAPSKSEFLNKQTPSNMTGVNTGTIDQPVTTTTPPAPGTANSSTVDQKVTDMGQPVYSTDSGTTIRSTDRINDQGTAQNRDSKQGNVMNETDKGNTIDGRYQNNNTGNRTIQNDLNAGGVTDNGVPSPGNANRTNTMNDQSTGALTGDLDNKTMTLAFDDGMVKITDPATGKTSRLNTETEVAETTADDPFSSCNYNVTSGSGALSTFSSKCTMPDGTRGMAYWNGFVNEGSISGNLVVYESDGNRSAYTFTGKATRKDTNRKTTSMK
jgi:hypothetical protein